MEDIIGQVLAVLIFGGLAVMAVYFTLQRTRGHKTRQEAAAQRGWEYQAIAKAVNHVSGETSDAPDFAVLYRLRGKLSDASPWQIETKIRITSNRVTAMEQSATWQTLSVGNPNLYIHITPKVSLGVTVIGGDQNSELKKISLEKGRYSLGNKLRRFGVEPPVGILETFHQLEMGPEGWQKKYNLYSNDEDAARRLLKSELPAALLNWAIQHKRPSRYPVITFCPQGVQVMLEWTVEDVDTLDQLVALGQTAVHASGEIG